MRSNAGFHRFHQDAADAKRLRLAPNRHGCLVMDESGHMVWCPSLEKNSHETTIQAHMYVIISAKIKHASINENRYLLINTSIYKHAK